MSISRGVRCIALVLTESNDTQLLSHSPPSYHFRAHGSSPSKRGHESEVLANGGAHILDRSTGDTNEASDVTNVRTSQRGCGDEPIGVPDDGRRGKARHDSSSLGLDGMTRNHRHRQHVESSHPLGEVTVLRTKGDRVVHDLPAVHSTTSRLR